MSLSPEVITAILGFAGAFLVKEAWDFIKRKSQAENNVFRETLDKNTDAIVELKIAIVELKVRIDSLTDKLTPVPKLVNDVNEAHAKIREISKHVSDS